MYAWGKNTTDDKPLPQISPLEGRLNIRYVTSNTRFRTCNGCIDILGTRSNIMTHIMPTHSSTWDTWASAYAGVVDDYILMSYHHHPSTGMGGHDMSHDITW
jgi:hypothetical protein